MVTEKQFKSFIATLPDCEVLEESKIVGRRRADFLFHNRHIVSDLKCLEADLGHKVGALLDQKGIVFYGSGRFDELISDRSDKEQLNKKALSLLTTSLEKHLRDANNQILSTIEDLGLNGALGVVVVINNGNLALEPNVVRYAISHLIMKRRDGGTRFPAIHGCLYMCEIHQPRKLHIQGLRAITALNVVITRGQPYDALSDYMNGLIRKWCAYRGIGHIGGTDTSVL